MDLISVKSPADKQAVSLTIDAYLTMNGECDVTVKKLDESLTDAQRKLYWVWCKIIGDSQGNTKTEQHWIFKKRFLLKIYVSDPDNHPEFVGVIGNMQTIKVQCPEQFPAMRKLVYSGLSITKAKKHNMIDMLNDVEAFSRDNNIRLPAPERKGLR